MKALELPLEDFRRLAANVVDLCAGYLCTLDERSPFPQTTGAESERLFDLDLPERGMGDQAFAALTDVIGNSRAQNGRFFGYVQGSGEPIAALTTWRRQDSASLELLGPAELSAVLLPPPPEQRCFRRDAQSLQSGLTQTHCSGWEGVSLERRIEGEVLPSRLHREPPHKGNGYRCSGSRGSRGCAGRRLRARNVS